MHITRMFILAVALSALGVTPLAALEVYRWTDENGVVHFSQTAPEDEANGVQTLDIMGEEEMGNGLGISEEDDPYGYKAHREEMDALWADIEKRREEARQRQEQAPSTPVVYIREEPVYPYIYPGYGYRPPHRPGRPPLRPNPPIAKPVPYKRP